MNSFRSILMSETRAMIYHYLKMNTSLRATLSSEALDYWYHCGNAISCKEDENHMLVRLS